MLAWLGVEADWEDICRHPEPKNLKIEVLQSNSGTPNSAALNLNGIPYVVEVSWGAEWSLFAFVWSVWSIHLQEA